MSRRTFSLGTFVLSLVAAAVFGFTAAAYASEVHSSWDRFYKNSSGSRCGDQRATAWNSGLPSLGVYAMSEVRARQNNCQDAKTVPAGHLAITFTVVFKGSSGTSGTACGGTFDMFNTSATAKYTVYAFRDDGDLDCGSINGTFYAATGAGIWKPSANKYIYADHLVYSPNLNYP